MRLGNLGEPDDEEGDGEDCHCDDHHGSCLGHCCICDAAADQPAYEDRSDGAAGGVAGAAPLDELVALVAAATQGVEHRVNDDVEHAHREAGHEGAQHIDSEALHITGEELDSHADKTDGNGCQGGEFIALALEDKAGGDAHASISNEVGEGSKLRESLGCAELIGDNHAHGTSEVRNERNHEEECEHHHDSRGVVLFLCSCHIVVCLD